MVRQSNEDHWHFFLHTLWPFECLILMILIMTKYDENLLKDSPLSLLSLVIFFSFLKIKMIAKLPSETFLRITRYHIFLLWMDGSFGSRSAKSSIIIVPKIFYLKWLQCAPANIYMYIQNLKKSKIRLDDVCVGWYRHNKTDIHLCLRVWKFPLFVCLSVCFLFSLLFVFVGLYLYLYFV